jgi:L,D-transpeptidase catalytic domain
MRLHRLALAFAAALAAVTLAVPARANIMIIIDKSAQKMTVTVNGEERYVWPVSTGRDGYDTPSGEFQPFRMERDHFSREWDDAPMPNSIFFTKIGHAIHGTYEARNLGRPVSHGCVRLSTQNAATLYALVKDEGVFNTRVRLTGTAPQPDEPVARRDRNNGNDREAARNRDSDRDAGRNRAYVRNYTADDDDTADVPPQRSRPVRGWQQMPDPRSYYYRPPPYYYSSPYYERRNYGRGLFSGW